MRKVLIGLFILLFVLAAAVFVGPSLIDWNDYKSDIAEAVEQQTGRQLSIDGDISLSLLPSPALSVRGVRLANVEGAENPDMASLRSLDVKVAFAPLLEGRIQVESLELVEPTILLEVLPDGRRNWEFSPPPETAESGGNGGSEGGSEGGFGGEVRFDRIAISDGTVIYRDAASGREERLEDLDARIAATSLKGPFSVSGDASYQGVGIGFDGGTGRLAPQGEMPLNLALTLDEAEGELRFNGNIDQSTSPLKVTGLLVAKGQDPTDFAAALGAPGALPEAISGPFQVKTELAYGDQSLSLGGISVVLADLRAEGHAAVDLVGEVPDAELTLRVSQLNLDTLLSESGGGSGGGDDSAPAASDIELPGNLNASLDLTVQTMIYKAQVVRDAVLRGRLEGGALQLEEASALLPGGSRFALSGDVVAAEAGPRFEGQLDAESDNLRTLLTWLEVDLDSISAERLRRASLTTRLTATPKQVDLTGIQAELDVSTITGGLSVALGKRPSFGAGITVDKINLDAYLGGGLPGGNGGSGDDGGGGANPLAGFDANLDLRAGQVTYQEQTLYDLHLDATVQNGGMTIRTARVGNLANSSATLSGRLEGLPDAPSLSDGSFDVAVNDPAAVSRVLGLGGDGPLVRLGPFTAKGAVSGSMQSFTLDGTIDSQPLSGSLAGSFSGLPIEPQVENGRFDLEISDPAALAAVGGMDDPDGTLARLGAVTLQGTASGGPQALTLDATAGLQGGKFALKGSASGLMDAPSFDLSLDAQHPNLAQLVAVLAPGQKIPQDSGALDLRAQLEGSPQRMAATGIQGTIGPADIAGEVIYDAGAERPLVTANLTAGALPLAAFAAAGGGGDGSSAPDDGERWSSEPIETGPLRRIDADIDLKADALVHEDWRLENATVLAKLREGVLTIEQLDGDLFGGKVAVNGTVTAGEDIAADLAVRADQVDTAKLVGVLGGIDRVSGPMSFSADLTTRGVSQLELVNNLNGSGVIDGNLQARASAEEKGLAVLLGFLGSQVKEVQGIADAAFLILNAFAGEAAKLSGTLNIENGVIRTDDGRLEGQGAFALLRGMAANLPAWQIDFATQLFQNADTENPFVTLGLIGPLDDPNTKLGGLAMQPGAQGGLQSLIGNLTGQGAQQGGGLQGAIESVTGGQDGGAGGLQGLIQGATGMQQGAQDGDGGQQPAGGLGNLIQGVTGGALGGQQQEQEAAPEETTQEEAPQEEAPAIAPETLPSSDAEPGPEGDEIEPLTETIEGEAVQQPDAQPEEAQPEETQEAAPAPQPEEVQPETQVEGVTTPSLRPESLEEAQPETQPEEEAAPEQPAEDPQPQEEVRPEQTQPETQPEPQEEGGENQLNKLLEGIGVREPEAQQQPSSDSGWQDPNQTQGTDTQGGTTTDSTTTDQTRQTDDGQQEEQQPGRNFINNILQGIQKN